MAKSKINFQIVPIFDQRLPGVWNDFVRIESACDTEIYDMQPPEPDTIRIKLNDYKSDFYEDKHCFAFAAYNRNRMLGFATGYVCDENESHLDRLYVLPKYHHNGIGSKLLNAAEQTAAIFANEMTLTPLMKSVDFYKKHHGYIDDCDFDCYYYEYRGYVKNLTRPANLIVPVFQWVKKDLKVNVDVPVDTATLKQNKHQPIFAHINDDCAIDAVATRTKDGTKKIWTKQPIYCPELLKALNKIR